MLPKIIETILEGMIRKKYIKAELHFHDGSENRGYNGDIELLLHTDSDTDCVTLFAHLPELDDLPNGKIPDFISIDFITE